MIDLIEHYTKVGCLCQRKGKRHEQVNDKIKSFMTTKVLVLVVTNLQQWTSIGNMEMITREIGLIGFDVM